MSKNQQSQHRPLKIFSILPLHIYLLGFVRRALPNVQRLLPQTPNTNTVRMQTKIAFFVLNIFLFGAVMLIDQEQVSAEEPSSPSDSMLIFFERDTDLETRDAVLDELNATLISWTDALDMAEITINAMDSLHASMVTAGSTATNRAMTNVAMTNIATSRLAQQSIVDVERDTIIVRGTYLPNDPALQERQKSYAQSLLQMEEAWDYTLGHPGAVIAILDTGLNPQHIEFGRPIVAGYNFVNDSTNYRDDHGHGTHIAGIIAAQINNSIGTVGICPQCSLIVAKVLDHRNHGTWSTVAKGIVYAVDNGADIINLSLGSDQTSQAIERAVTYAHENGVLIVAAAGNDRSGEKYYPSALDGVIGVSATDDRDEHWVLSNYGADIDLSAPGYMIYSTGGEKNISAADAFSYMTGTSMAAPHVAGVAGLLLSQVANRTPLELTNILIESSEDLGESGWDPKFGHGRVNAAKALASAGIPPTRQAQEITTIVRPRVEHQILLPLMSKAKLRNK